MTEVAKNDQQSPAGKRSPGRVDASTRVNVALPFSQLKIEQPSGELVALTTLVADLAAMMAEVAPGPQADELRDRARDLVSHVH